MEVTMPQRGEIVVERLTGNRAIVIRVVSPEEVTCRFADGRLEDRFTFELEPLREPVVLVKARRPRSPTAFASCARLTLLVVPSQSETGAVVVPVVPRA